MTSRNAGRHSRCGRCPSDLWGGEGVPPRGAHQNLYHLQLPPHQIHPGAEALHVHQNLSHDHHHHRPLKQPNVPHQVRKLMLAEQSLQAPNLLLTRVALALHRVSLLLASLQLFVAHFGSRSAQGACARPHAHTPEGLGLAICRASSPFVVIITVLAVGSAWLNCCL